MKTTLTTAQTKNLIRRARADYRRTHDLLGRVGLMGNPSSTFPRWCGAPVDADTVLAVGPNYRAAQALDALARSLPLTRQVVRLRKVADDNLSVAGEVVDCMTCRVNEGIKFI